MIQKIKLMFLTFSMLFSFATPLAATAVVSAQVTQQNFNDNLCSGSNADLTGATTGNCNDQATSSVNKLLTSIINIISIIVGVVAVIMIIIGGLRYITSGGDSTKVTGAKNTILYAIIGLVVVALAQIVVHFILNKTTNATV